MYMMYVSCAMHGAPQTPLTLYIHTHTLYIHITHTHAKSSTQKQASMKFSDKRIWHAMHKSYSHCLLEVLVKNKGDDGGEK